MAPRPAEATRAIYVRLPVAAAERLDRAAERLGASKRDVIASLLASNLDADVGASPARRRVIVEDGPESLAIGHHQFTPAATDGVLTLDEAAELLRVTPAALEAGAEAGDVPARRLGEEWRFRRDALLDWLALKG